MEIKTKFYFKNGGVDQEDRGYIEERISKLSKVLPKGEDKEAMAEVNITKDKKGIWNVEFLLDTGYNLFRSTENDHVLTEAWDRIEDSVTKQIKRKRGRVKDLRERGGRSIKKKIVLDENARF